jgi:serine/threonine protein kinase
MIDSTGTVKIIDFGSTRVAGVAEMAESEGRANLLGTAQYTAPEYFLGEAGTTRSDIFSLGVIGYQMLAGKLPYGAEVAKSRTKAAQNKLRYRPLLDEKRNVPAWIDAAIRKAVQPDPYRRYEELSEFIYDLRHPNTLLLNEKSPPLIDRNPLVFWQCVSFILTIITAVLLFR